MGVIFMSEITFLENQVDQIVQDYLSGELIKQIKKKHTCSKTAILKILQDKRIPLKNYDKRNRKYEHDEDFFKIIDTEEKAYWLGFLYADGYIIKASCAFGVTLSKKDEGHIEKLKKAIKAANPIHSYLGTGYSKSSWCSRLLISSKNIVSDLISHGLGYNKTFNLKFPNNSIVPEKLMHHFVRGYFDGDGSLSCYQSNYGRKKTCYIIGFTGTKEMIQGINNFFGKNLKITPHGKAYELNLGGNIQVGKFLSIMYKDATIWLDRKHQKYMDYLKYIER